LAEAAPPEGSGVVFRAHVRAHYNPLCSRSADAQTGGRAGQTACGGCRANLRSHATSVMPPRSKFLQAFVQDRLVPDTGGGGFSGLVGSAQRGALAPSREAPAARAVELGLIYKACPLAERGDGFGLRPSSRPPTGAIAHQQLSPLTPQLPGQQLEMEAGIPGHRGPEADTPKG